MDEFGSGTPQISPRCDTTAAQGVADQIAAMATYTVLIVEDDWVLRQNLVDELSTEGWTILDVESGEAALKLLDSGATVDLLITDVRLGGRLDGWDVAEAVRKTDESVSVIYLSANPILESRKVARATFLSKPYPAAKLLRACRALLGKE
jgi:DNA-binding response OmpR family regulator